VEGYLAGFSLEGGGVICRRCGQGGAATVVIAEKTLVLLQHLLADDFEAIDRIDVPPGDERRAAALVQDFVARCAEDHRPLVSLTFLERLKEDG